MYKYFYLLCNTFAHVASLASGCLTVRHDCNCSSNSNSNTWATAAATRPGLKGNGNYNDDDV